MFGEGWLGLGLSGVSNEFANGLSVVAQHYLLHLFRDKLVESKSRVIIVSSGAVRLVPQTGMSRSWYLT